MPAFPIVDTHVHLWDPTHHRLAWLDDDAQLKQRFDLSDYATHTQGVEIAAMVYLEVDVDPSYRLTEARWVSQISQSDPRLQGIVAAAPVEDGDCVRSFLDDLVAIDPRVRGVRRLVQAEPDPTFCARPSFVRGVQALADYGLSFDLGVRHPQLPAVRQLVQQCPRTQFVLDHIGKPDIAAHQMDPWMADITALAALPNVVCKVSGMVTEADHATWTPADLAPYLAHVLATFGEERVLFGGDWPVVLRAAPYTRWAQTLEGLTAHLSSTAARRLWADNARRVYRLP